MADWATKLKNHISEQSEKHGFNAVTSGAGESLASAMDFIKDLTNMPSSGPGWSLGGLMGDDGAASGLTDAAAKLAGKALSDAAEKGMSSSGDAVADAGEDTEASTSEAESEEEATASEESGPFYTLKTGDKDKPSDQHDHPLYNGEIRTELEKAKNVENLEKNLLKLGYWISNSEGGSGMVVDGVFDEYLKGAVYTFQKENGLGADGIAGPNTAAKIDELVKQSDYERPGLTAGNYGQFYQLEPSEDLNRYFPNYDSNYLLKDIWGTRETIDMVRDTAKDWKADGNSNILVGDISLHTGGNFPPHSSHKEGTGVDIDSSLYASINKSTFNKEKSLELANLLVEKGAKRILFNCKYVVDNCERAKALNNHHHHFHVDSEDHNTNPHPEELCRLCHVDVYNACADDVKAERTSDQLTSG